MMMLLASINITCHNFFPTKRLLVPRTIQAMLIRKNNRKLGILFLLLFQEGEKRRRANDPYLGVSLILAH